MDKATQHAEVQNFINRNSRSGRNWRKENALTGGGLPNHVLDWEKSADSIVVVDTSHANETDKQGGLTKQ